MKPQDVPGELIAILDRAAGREHARTGPVVACLAEILTRYDELIGTLADELAMPGAIVDRIAAVESRVRDLERSEDSRHEMEMGEDL